MGFSKRQHLQRNIDALRIAFALENGKQEASVDERLILQQYSGFGGLKFVLNPVGRPEDIGRWAKSEKDLLPHTLELHQVLRDHAADDKQYHRYVESMKASVLTAFYTPPPVIGAIALNDKGIEVKRMLEPAAGIGAFIETFTGQGNSINHITAYEKDILTGKVLEQLYPKRDIRISGFEEIPGSERESYDLVTGNTPFGDTSVFDHVPPWPKAGNSGNPTPNPLHVGPWGSVLTARIPLQIPLKPR